MRFQRSAAGWVAFYNKSPKQFVITATPYAAGISSRRSGQQWKNAYRASLIPAGWKRSAHLFIDRETAISAGTIPVTYRTPSTFVRLFRFARIYLISDSGYQRGNTRQSKRIGDAVAKFPQISASAILLT